MQFTVSFEPGTYQTCKLAQYIIGTRKQSTANLSKNKYQEVSQVCFSENLLCFAFLLPPCLGWLFCLITDKNS